VPTRSRLLPFALAAIIAVSPAALLWAFFRPGELDYVLTNLADSQFPRSLLTFYAVSTLAVAPVYLGFWLRRPDRSFAGVLDATRSCNAILLPLLVCPPLAALAAPSIESKAPFFTTALIAFVALVIAISSHRWLPARMALGSSQRAGPWRRRAPLVAALAAAAAYATAFSYFSILNHRGLNFPSFDLAIYDNLVWNTSQGDFLASILVRGGTHLSAHFDPLLVLLTPFHLLWPDAETLLVFQSFWLASSAIPLFLLGSTVLRSTGLALLVAFVFLMHPALHGINLYEFHSLALVTPLIVWALYSLERESTWGFAVSLALILLTREDMALLSCGIGLYVADTLRRPRFGLAIIACSLLYFAVVKTFVMPDPGIFMSGGSGSYSYREHFEQMIPHEGGGAVDFVLTLVTNPVFALRVGLEESKLLYAILMLLPCVFLPLGTRTRLLLLAYGAVFCLLSSKSGPHSVHKQYGSIVLPFIWVLTLYGLREVPASRTLLALGLEPARSRRALVAAVLVASVLVSWKFGGIATNTSFRVGGWRRPIHFRADELPQQRARYTVIAEAVAQIPPSASVSATRFLLPHVSARKEVHIYPRGRDSDYLLVREKSLKGRGLSRFEEQRGSPDFEEVTSGEGIVLLRRRVADGEHSAERDDGR
jgi:uncharacterized membrane protein